MIRKFGATGIDSQPQGLDLGLGGGSNIKSIQRGLVALASADVSKTAIIAAVDITKAIIKITHYSPSDSSGNSGDDIDAVITNSTTLTFTRTNTGAAKTVAYEVIEFNNVKSLQSGAFTFSTASQDITISSVSLSKAFFMLSYSSASQSYISPDLLLAYLGSTTTIHLAQYSALTKYIKWQVIEFN